MKTHMTFQNAREFDRWLAAHHATAAEVWLMIAKKGSGRTTLTIREALEVALCHGWIDSQRRSCDGPDDGFYLQRYSPRRPGSPWSRINVDRVEALTAGGRMRAAGVAEVAAAKADGRWEAAYASQANAAVPEDLRAALDAHPAAGRAFGVLTKTQRYQIIVGLLKAKTPATRAARLEKALNALNALTETGIASSSPGFQ